MGVVENRAINDLDPGLRALKDFIKASGISQQSDNRELDTDMDYEFTIYTTLLKQHNQRQAQKEKYVVKVPAGSTLYFPQRSASTGNVNGNDFIVNDGEIAWHINTYDGRVRRLRHTFRGKVARPLPKPRTEE